MHRTRQRSMRREVWTDIYISLDLPSFLFSGYYFYLYSSDSADTMLGMRHSVRPKKLQDQPVVLQKLPDAHVVFIYDNGNGYNKDAQVSHKLIPRNGETQNVVLDIPPEFQGKIVRFKIAVVLLFMIKYSDQLLTDLKFLAKIQGRNFKQVNFKFMQIRKSAIFVLFLAMILALSGCGKKSEPQAENRGIINHKGNTTNTIPVPGNEQVATSSSEIVENATSTGKTGETTTSTEKIAITEELNASNLGTIEGSLSYPSEVIPELKVCAENIKTKEKYCTKDQIDDKKYTYYKGYRIKVPSGKYLVFAEDINLKKAFYSEFVTCGLKIECLSHKAIVVNVENRETVSNIDLLDWYNNPIK